MSKPSSYHLTKIIATLGPATSNTERIDALFDAGANCFRLNFSHGTQQQHSEVYERIRETEDKKDYPVGVIADLQGPKLRLAKMPAEGCEVESGSSITLKLGDDLGSSSVCWIPHPEIFKVVNAGDRLLLDDGLICLRATKRQGETIQAQVEVGGTLKSNKGINLPGVHLPISALTERDKENLDFALDLGADWIALSFVQSPEDIIEARKLVGKRAKLIAKIEKPSAVKHIDAIIEATDGIMIARGDLGVEIDAAEVPSLQKRLIRLCRNASVPVIVATQMLESMTSNPAPTRAEASDVATAVYEGADAVMLSAETATGSYPIESVDIMRRIIVSTESDPNYRRYLLEDNESIQPAPAGAIVAAAIRVAEVVGASCIAAFSQTGSTTLRASHLRPSCPLLGLTPLISTARMASLFWGVRSIKAKDLASPGEMSVVVSEIAKRYGFAVDGESIIITAGIPLGQPGGTNILRLSVVGADESH